MTYIKNFKMNTLSRLSGLIPISIGLLLGYCVYLFVLNVYIVFKWLSEYLNAPEALAIVFTILIIICLLGVFTIVIVIILYLISLGILMLFERY